MTLEVYKNNLEQVESFKNKLKGIKAYEILKALRIIENEIKQLEEFRVSLILKYGIKNEEGNYEVNKDSENYNKVIEEFSEVANQEVDLGLDITLNKEEIKDLSISDLDFLELMGVKILV